MLEETRSAGASFVVFYLMLSPVIATLLYLLRYKQWSLWGFGVFMLLCIPLGYSGYQYTLQMIQQVGITLPSHYALMWVGLMPIACTLAFGFAVFQRQQARQQAANTADTLQEAVPLAAYLGWFFFMVAGFIPGMGFALGLMQNGRLI